MIQSQFNFQGSQKMLSTTQTTSLDRGMAFLRATGLRFAIEMPDQTYLGSLPVPAAQPEPVVTVTRRATHAPLNPKYEHKTRVDTLDVGGLLVIDADTEDDATRLASNVSARGVFQFGKGSCISSRNGLRVELLRIV
jgi:hypothetical protein